MDKFRKFLSGTRKDLALQIIFTLFVIVIPNQIWQILILSTSIILITISTKTRPAININLPKIQLPTRSTVLLKWVVTAGMGYLLLPYIWSWGIEFGLDFGLMLQLLIACTVIALGLPPILVSGRRIITQDNNSSGIFIGLFGWVMGILIPHVVKDTAGLIIPAFLIAIVLVTIILPKSILWFIANMISGATYSFLLSKLFVGSAIGFDFLLPGCIASLAASLITGLAYDIFIERDAPDL